MTLPFPRFLLFHLFAAAIGFAGSVHARETESPAPIKALLVTGGSGQDFETQQTLITFGIAARCRIPIEWKIVHQGGNSKDARIPLYNNKDWAKGFDIVIHNECFPEVTDKDWVEKILQPHRDGIPAILIHGALQSYPVEGNTWTDFCGARTEKTDLRQPFEVQLAKDDHPVTNPIRNWTTPNDELLIVKETSPLARVLAQSKSTKDGHLQPAIWAHKYGENKTKVFVTTIGAENESIEQPEYLDMLTSGFLWAIGVDIEKNLMIRKALEDSILLPGRNLFTGQSSRSSSENSDLAIDGDPSTNWEPDRGRIINWWRGSLAEPTKMDSLVVIWQSPIQHPYWIEGSIDGRIWEEIVTEPAPEKAKKVSFHEFDGTYQHLRISNPDTGILGGMSEFAAYQNRREVPSHLISAAFPPGKSPLRRPREKPEKPGPVLSPDAAFSLLDSIDHSGKWNLALNDLSNTFEPAVVDGLISRIDKTTSGLFRHLAIPALGNLYRTPEGGTWPKSPEIAVFLENEFSNRRVDKRQLLEVFLRDGIPIKDPSKVILPLLKKPELKPLLLKILEGNPVPYGAIHFPTAILRDDSEPPEVRLRAAVLLSSSAEMLAMRDAFELAAQAADWEIGESLKDRLSKSVLGNPTWESQLDWLIEKSSGTERRERIFAWEILIAVLQNPRSRERSKDLVLEAMKNSEAIAGPSFLSLIATISLSENEKLRAILERARKNDFEPVAKAAAAALEESIPGKTFPSLKEMTMEEIRNAVVTVRDADARRGQSVYSENCGKCHSQKPIRLSDLLKRDVISDVLTPDEQISGGHHTFEFTMLDGNVFSGFIGSETDHLIELIDQAGNSAFVEKDKIKERKKISLSTMPRSAADHLTIREFADLLAYLKTL